MKFQNRTLLTSALLAAAALSLSACGDDPVKPVDVVDCDVTPNHAECQTTVDCDVTPDHADCQTAVDCNATPDAEECKDVDCTETPDHELCVVATCEDIDALILDAIAPKDTAFAEIVQPTVRKSGENYRVLTFKAGGNQDPNLSPRLYLDIETNSFLDISDVEALTNTVWDIAFDAVGYVYTNSGQSGPGKLMVGTVPGVATADDFKALAQPGRGDITWVTDSFINEATCEKSTEKFLGVDFLTTAIGPWFNYKFDDHSTNPKPNAYVIYNSADNHHAYKIQFQSYNSGTTEIKLAVAEFLCEDAEEALLTALDPKATPAVVPEIIVETEEGYNQLVIDASLGGAAAAADSSWVYVNLRTNEILELSDVEALESHAWDLAFKRAEIRLNSINSGPRGLRVTKVDDVDSVGIVDLEQPAQQGTTWLQDVFIDERTCDVFTYGQDSIQTALGQWYEYDMSNHTLSAPEDVIYVVYDSNDNHNLYKFQIADYTNGLYTIAVKEFPRR